jgi:hypothetical protein
MLTARLLPQFYLRWHYSAALARYWQVAANLLWFVTHFFSLALLVKTFFAPWRRLGESYPTGFRPSEFLAAFFVNFLMRLVGIIIRALMILVGLLVWAVAALGALAGFVLWLALPLVIAGLILVGLKLLLWP